MGTSESGHGRPIGKLKSGRRNYGTKRHRATEIIQIKVNDQTGSCTKLKRNIV